MGATNALSLPFPELTETADGPDAFSDLANAVEDYFYDRILPAGVTRMPSYHWGTGTTYPVSTLLRAGDTYFHTTAGLSFYDGTDWVTKVSIDQLRLTATGDASATSTTHAFQVGPDTSSNIIIDQNEIIGRNNGVLAGSVGFGTNKLSQVGDPTGVQDAATKNYVDTVHQLAAIDGSAASTQVVATGTNSIITLNASRRATGMTVTTASGRINATKAGIYLVSGGINTSASGVGRWVAYIALNGTIIDEAQNRTDTTINTTLSLATPTVQIYMAAGDYVQLGVRQDSGADRTINKEPAFLQAVWLANGTS